MMHPMCLEKTSCIDKITLDIPSEILDRTVQVDIYLPTHFPVDREPPLLLINDGQNMDELGLVEMLSDAIKNGSVQPLIAAAIHCGPDRKQEYGTADHPDYLGRGNKAAAYTNFIFEECLPELRNTLPWKAFKEKAFAGFSLGGLSALDIVWAHPHEFSKVGVFSGSLWWRDHDQADPDYDDDQHRIMHQLIRKGSFAPWLKFFFETGTQDETSDRNNNGIIDSIDDTNSLIEALEMKGYQAGSQIKYLELKDGRHDIPTWAKAMPHFLKWAFPGESNHLQQ